MGISDIAQNVVSTAAYIRYDTAHFRVNSVDTSESVFLMESEMLIDSDIGEIKITRGSTSPGVNTSNGKIARINLTALYPIIPEDYNFTFKESQISPYESCVIADYPLGTNILSMVSNGRFVFSNSSLYGDFEGDCDVDGRDIAIIVDKDFLLDIASFAQKFGISGCP